MKFENRCKYRGFIIKVSFWGDSITPMYKYKLYIPRANWFPKLVYIKDVHQDGIENGLSSYFDEVIANYEKELKLRTT